ncbi:fibronectin type III domain-containing protein [Fulvivirgaceae bacterium PWU4]|uniref:Fibronectin type III domain-containing protein n=1 Tax=Chryseosolibacter histidini TaxID=2782349 RepID=A0AAP2DVG5_9BACT|nr:fibronectin type III domain-containing protein [Chryseosolibacter histidini]MBT1701459.1 fibronectin type III domain-containing protein [Chryseosolibacter histidini]
MVTEISPAKPTIEVKGTTHLRGPGLVSNDANNTVVLRSVPEAELYTWYKNGVALNFPNTDVNDTLRTATLTTSSAGSNGAYTLVTSYSYCPSPPSDPVQLFFNNSAPQNMVFDATAANFKGTLMPSGVFLSWNDLVSNETAYEIWRKKAGTADFKFAGRTAKDAISFYDGGLEPGTTYLYKLRAVSKTGASNYVPSNDVNINYQITTGGDATPPSPPQELTMTANTISSITLAWKPAADNTGIQRYEVTYGGTTISTDTSLTTFTITGLPANTEFPVYVTAVDHADHVSPPSNQITGSTYVLGLNYKHSTGAWIDLDDPTMVATWADPEFTGKVKNFSLTPRTQEDFFNFQFSGYFDIPATGDYIFRLSSDDGSRMFLDADTIIDNNGSHSTVVRFSDTLHLTAGPHPVDVYYFDYSGGQSLSVQYKGPDLSVAYKAVPDSMIRSGAYKPPVIPAVPLNLVAQGSGMQRIDLSWQSSTGDVEVYRSAAANGTFAIVGRSGTGVYADTTGLTPGTTYYYKVKTVTAASASAFSTIVSATTAGDSEAPSVPLSLQLSSKTQTQVALTWTASTDNVAVTTYEVFSGGQLAGSTSLPAFTVTELAPGTAYNITVKAVDASGNRSAMSAPLAVTTAPSAMYYAMATGALNNVATWKQQPNGTGSSPADFTTNGQFFVISNRTQTSVGGPWEISGNASKLIVPTGVTLTVDQPLTATVDLEGTATLNLNHETVPVLNKLSAASTVNFNVYGFIPSNTYGNIQLSGSGTKTFDAGATHVSGNVTIANGLTVKGAPGNETVLTVGGNLIANGTLNAPASDNRIDLRFTENTAHTLSAAAGLNFYQITAGTNAAVTVQGDAQKIILGSSGGGGLALATGASFNIGARTLHISGAGVVNAQNETGKISVNGGDVKITSSSGMPSNLYFDATNNNIDTLLIDCASGSVAAQAPASIAGAVVVNGGVLNANGQVTLLSTATRTAVIAPLGDNAAITGNVNVQRYLEPLGEHWRDLSAPVAGVTVAHWQNYFAITGQFTGASAGSSEPSMFISNGTGLTAYPFAGGSNQAAIEKGRGYAVKLNGASPVTLQMSGNPFQGNVSFNLNGGTGGGADDGWNLVGNPYASPITWSADGGAWSSAGIVNTIAIRESKTIDGQMVTRYIYHNALLAPGIIGSGQAFWVRTYNQSPSLMVTEKAKTVTPEIAPVPETATHIVVRLMQGAREDATYILFTETGTDAFDDLYDAIKKQNEGMFNLSSLTGNNINVAVNTLGNSFCSKTVKLNVQQVPPGNYTLGFDALESVAGVGHVTLTDHYTNHTVTVDASGYAFAVDANPASYGTDRFTLTFARTQLDVNTPQVQASAICGQDDAVITIAHSQAGAEYVVLNENEAIISEAAEGNGESLVLALHKDKLITGTNHVRVKAAFRGCEEQLLPAQVAFDYTPDFSISVQDDASVCQGEQAMLQASGAPAGGSYKWYDEDHTELGTHASTLLTPPVFTETIFYVAGVNAGGCESALNSIRVYADTLETPEIIFYNDTLFTQVEAQFQWRKDGAAIPGATKPFFKPEQPGNYTVVAFTGGCSRESLVYNYNKDPDCQINTTAPVAEAGNTCGSDAVIITLGTSETGVVYTAINENDDVISAPGNGNGTTIALEVSGAALSSGENNIRIKATRQGCADRILASVATFDYVPPFAVIAPDTINVCRGVDVMIRVSGSPEGTYAWYDASGEKIEGATYDSYVTAPIETATVVHVSAIHGGCEGEQKTIHIIPDGLGKPVITVQDNVLSTQVSGSLQWKLNGTPIAGATANTFTPTASGLYTVVVSQGNCSQESDGFEFSVTGIDDGYSKEFVLHAYPVPANSNGFSLKVQSPRPEQVFIEIIDITGRKVFTRSYTFEELRQGVPVTPVSGPLTEGVYCVIATQGKTEVRKRVVVNNR